MNRIFRVIWNHATQSWVAVSELASAKGKTKSKTISKLAALSLVVGSAVSMDVLAAYTTITATATSKDSNILIGNVDNITRDLPVVPKNMIIIGNNTKAQSKAAPNAPGFKQVDDEEIIIGNDMTALNSGRAADTIIGNRIRFGGSGNDSMSTAMGYGAHVSSSSVSIGVGARSDVGSFQPWEEPMAGGVAVGQFSSAGGNTNSVVSIGAGSGGTRDRSVNIGVLSGASDLFYDREVAEPGNGGKVYSFGSSSFGAVSVGYKAAAGGQYGVAIGEGSIVSRNGSRSAMAMGHSSTSIGENSIAIGENSVAGGHTEAQIKTLQSKLTTLKGDKFLGTAVTRLEAAKEKMQALPNTENKFQVASAQAALDRLNFEIARLEREITFLASGTTATTSAIAIGNSTTATNESALAIGDRANSTAKASIAQGKQATATAENAISVGTSSNVSGENSVALGANITKLTTENSVVLGANSTEVVGTTGASHAVQTVNDATVRTIAGPNFTYSGFVGKPADAGHYVSISAKLKT
ncbi:ESPR-type extended signal peptide-containing protein [Haemophilus sp. Marseille-P9675]|uniref:ESPR-type extended signal peptide-containing protein n=1 Tax=Haemophilus sp. Marseille-P9675 TaxID=2866579 RepID=UPI001CF809D7|nr:ESPR-type extended signal peptide-containing protein [Haemophilus sp. Marseille-P9675]